MSSNQSLLSALLGAAGVVGGAYCAYHIYHRTSNKLPDNWTAVGTLKNIYVYPIKSCGPVKITDAECTHMGLRNFWLKDRVLMIIDSKNNFITARMYPGLLRVHPAVSGSVLTMTHAELGSVSVNLAEVISAQSTSTATVWGTPVPVFDCGTEVSEWFSKLLSTPGLRLVYYSSNKCRKLRDSTDRTIFKFTSNDTGALPDETSYNLINEASVEDLNGRLDKKVSHLNFRSNFVLEGAAPFDEDNWKYIKIGENIFQVIKPCVRCVLTTIDPETGIRDSKKEPLETLRGYRLATDPMVRKATGTAPRMGVQLALRTPPGGTLQLNDPVYVAY